MGISADKLAAFNSGAECNKHINELEVGVNPVEKLFTEKSNAVSSPNVVQVDQTGRQFLSIYTLCYASGQTVARQH